MTAIGDHLVGRAAEMVVVDDALRVIREGSAACLAVQGEPGIGKTRLLAELAARADARGCTVLTGSASELERDLPFWVFVDALDEYVAGLDPQLVASLRADVRVELAQVLPSLADHAADGGPVLQDERYRTHRAVRELLERLAVRRPLVLALDDVHWADPASVELLAALLRSPPDAAVLLVVAGRPRQLPERLAGALHRADRHGSVTRLDLAGLPREAAAELLGEVVGHPRADALYADSGGNPFYLQQLARADGAGGDGAWLAGVGLEEVGVPTAVIASLAEELGLLSDDTRSVLRGAAVSGDPFELDLAAAAAGVSDAVAMDAFDELLDLGLIRATDVPLALPLPSSARATRGVRERAGRVAARRPRALRDGPRPPQRALALARAHHVEHAARHGDLDSVAVLAEAGTSALLRAPASAARWLGAALRLMSESAPAQMRVELLHARARALAAEGRLAESHADLLACLALVPADATGLTVQLTTTCAAVERLLGRHDEAHARLRASLDRLEELGARCDRSHDRTGGRRAPGRGARGGLHVGATRLAAARDIGDDSLTAGAWAILALGHAVAERTQDAADSYAAAAAMVAALPDEELGARSDAAAHLTSAATFLDRYDEAVAHAERALRLGRAAG